MATTYELIKGETLASSAASYTFSAIPSTFTDLLIKVSARSDASGLTQDNIWITLNATSSGYSTTALTGNGSAASSNSTSSATIVRAFNAANSADATANAFGLANIYIPSYNASQVKPLSSLGASETNLGTSYMSATAGLSNITAAITSIKLQTGNGTVWVADSSFYLYGIKNS